MIYVALCKGHFDKHVKSIATKAIILRRLNFEEADRILTVITPEHGKVSLFARGARRSKSKLAGGLELFSISDIVYIDGKSELKTIISARLDRHFRHVVSAGVDITMLGYDFLKLVDQHTQDSCDASFYYLLEHGLAALDAGENVELVKAWFFVQILRLSGRSISVVAQANGDPFLEDALYVFDYDNMGFLVHENGLFSPRHIKFLRLLAKVSTPSHILRVENADVLAHELVAMVENAVKME